MDALAVRLRGREIGGGEGGSKELAGLFIIFDGDAHVVVLIPGLVRFHGDRVHGLRAPAPVFRLVAERRLLAVRAGRIDIERILKRLGLGGLALRSDLRLDGDDGVLRLAALGIINIFLAVLVHALGVEPAHVEVSGLAAGVNAARVALLQEFGILLGQDLARRQVRDGVVDVIDVAQQADLQVERIERIVAVRRDARRLRHKALIGLEHRVEFELVHRNHGHAGGGRIAQPGLLGHPGKSIAVADGAVAVDTADDLIGRVVGARTAQRGRVAAGLGNGSRAEVAVKCEERDGQGDGILARELDKALYICAVREALIIVGFLRVGQLQGHGDLCSRTGGNRELVAVQAGGIGRVELLCIVLREIGDLAALDEAALCSLAEALQAERIGLGFLGEVDDAELHLVLAGLLGIVAQLELGLVGALDGDVSAGLHGVADVGKACTLTADEVIGAVRFIDDRRCRAHKQAVGDLGIVLFRDGGRLQILPQQRHGGGDGRRRH